MKMCTNTGLNMFVENDCWHRIHSRQKARDPSTLLETVKQSIQHYGIRRYELVGQGALEAPFLDGFARALQKEKISIAWSAWLRVAPGMHEPFFGRLKEAGCRKIVFEVFSGSAAFLKKIQAGFSPKEVQECLRACHGAGITVGIALLAGHPAQTAQDREATGEFLRANRGLYDEVSRITHCLSSYLHENMIDFAYCSSWERCRQSAAGALGSVMLEEYRGIEQHSAVPVRRVDPAPAILSRFSSLADYSIKTGRMALRFENGSAHISADGRKLTTGLGVYTSIFARGFWQDSRHAATWQMKKVNETTMQLSGSWESLPIRQHWEARFLDDTTLELKIEMEVLEETVLEGEQQINVMLDARYARWRLQGSGTTAFVTGFTKEWVTLGECPVRQGVTLAAVSDEKGLPAVSLRCAFDNPAYKLAVLNTSDDFNGRVLKCYYIDGRPYLPGRYAYFEGTISINES